MSFINNRLERDIISGYNNLYIDLSNKPRNLIKRSFPESGDNCIFCNYSEQILLGCDRLIDDTLVIDQNNNDFVINNKWGIFNNEAELVIAGSHVRTINELRVDKVLNLLNLFKRRVLLNKEKFKNTLSFFNIGVLSGGSIEHLHGQVVGVDSEISSFGRGFFSLEVIENDITNSLSRDLIVIKEDEENYIYIPQAGLIGGEVRIYSDSIDKVSILLNNLLNALDIFSEFSYNLIFHFIDNKFLVSYIPRHELGIIYPIFLDTYINHYDNYKYKENILKYITF